MAISIDTGTVLVNGTANDAAGVNSRFTTLDASIEDALSSLTEITDGVEFKTTNVAASSIKTVVELEWDPSDGSNLTDNSSGIALDFVMPDDGDNQDTYARIVGMVRSDGAGAEEGELSFRGIDGGTVNTEWMTVSGAGVTIPGILDVNGSIDADVTDVDIASSGDIDLTSTSNAADAIYLRTNAGTSETIKIHADQGTSVTEGASSVQLLSDAGGVELKSTANLAKSIKLIADGGTSETIYIQADQGTSESSIQLVSDAGGIDIDAADGKDVDIAGGQINLTSSDNAASAIYLRANAGTSETIKIHADQGSGAGSITLVSDAGGIDVDATAGGVTIDSAGISLDASAASNFTTSSGALTITSAAAATWSTAAGVLTINGTGGIKLREGGSDIITINDSRAVATANTASIDLDASGAITMNSSGGTLSIGNDNDDQVVNLATAGTRTLNIGINDGTDVTTIVSKGNITNTGTLTVGVNDTGHDVKFFGDTDGKYLLWDTSADSLNLIGDLDVNGAADISGDLTLSAGADGALRFTNAGENSIKIPDNQASALIIEEANDAYMTFITTNSYEGVNFSKKVFINDTANPKSTMGLTINQAGNDDEALSFQSSSVGHGMTDQTEADTYSFMKKANASEGGLNLSALADTGTSIVLNIDAMGGAANTTKTTGGWGLVNVNVRQRSGTNIGAVDSDGNVFSVRAYSPSASLLTKFMIDEDGDVYAVNTTVQAFSDDKDDVKLLRALDHTRAGHGTTKGFVKSKWDEFVKYNEQDLVDAGVLGDTVENGGMWNVTQHVRLQNGALWQMYERLLTMAENLENNVPSLKGKLLPQLGA